MIVSEQILTCINHPDRETTLRCNRCGQPICTSCAIQTPVGYRCPACVRGQQQVFETAIGFDYAIAAVLGLVGVGLGTFLLGFLGFWGFFLAPVMGGGLAEGIRTAVRRRRSRNLPLTAAIGGALGVLIYIGYAFGPLLAALLTQGSLNLAWVGRNLVSILWPLGHGALVITILYMRLRAIRT